MILSIIVTYISGRAIGGIPEDAPYSKLRKKLIVFESVFINIGILVTFKYFNFIIDNLNFFLQNFQIELIDNPFNFLLPVGISFYTFQALSYTIDVYRGDVKPEKNFLKYALFVSFFPQLVAGPIERSKDLLTQVNNVSNFKLWNFSIIKNGIILMIWGFFLKTVIADRAAILVNTVFSSFYMYSSFELLTAIICFAIQIYCDFSGYSTIAIGAAHVMGFKLTENFNVPYFSRSIKEYWRRWHISLGTWIKDYIYIPLGGSKCSKKRKYFNLFFSYFIIGVWHGANWTYIIACSMQGLYQIIGAELKPLKEKINTLLKTKTESISYILGQVAVTFILNLFSLIFFRAQNVSDALYYLKRIFTKVNPWALFNDSIYKLGLDRLEINVLLTAVIVLFIVDCIKYFKNERIDTFLDKQCIWFRWGTVMLLIFSIFIYGVYGPSYDSSQFIYFQF